MKISLSFSLIIAFIYIFPSGIIAQGNINELSFDYFSQADGLPNNQIQCIFQDKKGWIWLGTSQGLSRFDGYRFVNFVHNQLDTTSLNGNLVRVIFEDKKGNLFVGTENGGLNLYNSEKERFTHPYKNNLELGSEGVSVNTMVNGSDGILYIGTDRSFLKIDTTGHLQKIVPSNGLIKNGYGFAQE